MKRFLSLFALVCLALIPVVASAQATALPYQMQWGEHVQGGQVYANDKHIVDRLERVFVDAYQGGSIASDAKLLDAPTEVVDKGSNSNASGTFTAPHTGYYRVSIQATTASGSAVGLVSMYASSTAPIVEAKAPSDAAASAVSAHKVVPLTAGDTVKFYLNQGIGTVSATCSWQIEALPW